MKKLIISLLIIVLSVVGLCACGGIEFEINFIVDGETYDTVKMNGNEIVKIPIDPTKEGYTFDGWYLDNGIWEKPFTANSLLNTPISSNIDMSVYAKWKSNSHSHTLSDWITDNEATCKAAGSKHKKCTECGEILENGTIEKLTTHILGEAVVENFIDSDCKSNGSYNSVVYCLFCGEMVSNEAKTVEKKEHSPSEWHSYGEEGIDCEEKMYFALCGACGEDMWREGTPEDHNYETVTVLPTCTQKGYTKITCSYCEKYTTANYVDEKPHKWQTTYLNDDFYHWVKCQNCTTTNSKIEHTLGNDGLCTVCKVSGATQGVLYSLSDNGKYAIVTGYEGDASTVKIAEKYNGVPVTHIGDSAFRNNHRITTVILTYNITSIGSFAFFSCDRLENIGTINTPYTMISSVTEIGKAAFRYCTKLRVDKFEVTNGWWYTSNANATSGTSINSIEFTKSGSNPSRIHETLTVNYDDYYLKCS